MKYFGTGFTPRFGEHVEAPVGKPCVDCDVAVVQGDSGFILPFHGSADDEKEAVYHRACLARCLGIAH